MFYDMQGLEGLSPMIDRNLARHHAAEVDGVDGMVRLITFPPKQATGNRVEASRTHLKSPQAAYWLPRDQG